MTPLPPHRKACTCVPPTPPTLPEQPQGDDQEGGEADAEQETEQQGDAQEAEQHGDEEQEANAEAGPANA